MDIELLFIIFFQRKSGKGKEKKQRRKEVSLLTDNTKY